MPSIWHARGTSPFRAERTHRSGDIPRRHASSKIHEFSEHMAKGRIAFPSSRALNTGRACVTCHVCNGISSIRTFAREETYLPSVARQATTPCNPCQHAIPCVSTPLLHCPSTRKVHAHNHAQWPYAGAFAPIPLGYEAPPYLLSRVVPPTMSNTDTTQAIRMPHIHTDHPREVERYV